MVLVLPTTPFKDVYIVISHISKEDFRLSTTLVPIEILTLAFVLSVGISGISNTTRFSKNQLGVNCQLTN